MWFQTDFLSATQVRTNTKNYSGQNSHEIAFSFKFVIAKMSVWNHIWNQIFA